MLDQEGAQGRGHACAHQITGVWDGRRLQGHPPRKRAQRGRRRHTFNVAVWRNGGWNERPRQRQATEKSPRVGECRSAEPAPRSPSHPGRPASFIARRVPQSDRPHWMTGGARRRQTRQAKQRRWPSPRARPRAAAATSMRARTRKGRGRGWERLDDDVGQSVRELGNGEEGCSRPPSCSVGRVGGSCISCRWEGGGQPDWSKPLPSNLFGLCRVRSKRKSVRPQHVVELVRVRTGTTKVQRDAPERHFEKDFQWV